MEFSVKTVKSPIWLAPVFALLLLASSMPLAHAYAPEGDLLKTKGYSPALINTIGTQRNRQEWRQPPAPRRTPLGNAMHNIYNNDWIGSFDDFGNRIIREQQ